MRAVGTPSEEVSRLAAHPVRWKIQNVQGYLDRPAKQGKGTGSAKRRKV
jgi:hypothetical protein